MYAVWADVVIWPVFAGLGALALGAAGAVALIVWAVRRLRRRRR